MAIAFVAGCSFTPGAFPGGADGDASTDDATGDDGGVLPDGPPACGTWAVMPSGIDPCTAPAPTGALDLCTAGMYTYSTTDGTITGTAAPASTVLAAPEPDVRVVSVTELIVCSDVELRIAGTHPVAFLVHGIVRIDGTIDASAWLNDTTWEAGPGAEVACGGGTGPTGTTSTDGAGGGGGGGFGLSGGAGGPGDTVAGVDGGTEDGTATLSPLRGGCAGGPGGNGDGSAGRGAAGRGGGAIQIAARDGITIDGAIRASGGPGLGGTASDAGGGGGGSGGAILLEGASVAGSGALCANGGGGGGGASDGGGFNSGGAGGLGACAESAATGGSAGGGGGSAGGKGGFGTTAAETGKSGSEGGGGGGGAVGRIRVRASDAPALDGVVTPPAT